MPIRDVTHVSAMCFAQHHRSGFAKPKLLLVLAVAALLFQLPPSLWSELLWSLDVRNWSRGAWLGLNVAAILGLLAIHFRGEIRGALSAVRSFTSRSRSTTATGEPRMIGDDDYETWTRRDAEWRERARKRLPFT